MGILLKKQEKKAFIIFIKKWSWELKGKQQHIRIRVIGKTGHLSINFRLK